MADTGGQSFTGQQQAWVTFMRLAWCLSNRWLKKNVYVISSWFGPEWLLLKNKEKLLPTILQCKCEYVCLCVSSLAFGNCNGLAVVDYLQKTILLCVSTLDLYGAADPYQRLTRSPRRNRQSTSGSTHTRTKTPGMLLTHTCTDTTDTIMCLIMSFVHPDYQLSSFSVSFLSVSASFLRLDWSIGGMWSILIWNHGWRWFEYISGIFDQYHLF